MAEQPRDATLCTLVDQLNELVTLAGSPSLSDLRKFSRNSSRELAESTTHDILAGKRKRAPEWPWVFSFITACRTAAEQTGLDIQPLSDVKAWHDLWRAARDNHPAPARPAPPANDEQEQKETPPSSSPSPSPAPSREYLLRVFGRSGIRVLFASDARNAQDCMRLAVIALLRDWPEDARPWLRRAEEAGHPQATELLNRPKHRELAAHLAYQYGQDFQQQRPGHLSMAMFFYRLAGDSGHTEAAYQLGCAHRSRGEPWVAAGWFRRAALDGHPAAIAEFTGAADQLTDSHTDRHNA
ncbi:hypothetical protein AB0M50_19825 [Nonomuraea fuscirosea]|uniref:hypothetical protein n=1 Tax=Nonomuraea fuscirosea TaxID=1291556 RepID=UPI00341DF772